MPQLAVSGTQVQVSNLDKVLYPATGTTKKDVLDYYARVAPTLLPHLARRPLILRRFPDGVEGPSFHQRQCPEHGPEWMPTVSIWSESNQENVRYCTAPDLASLLWIVNLAALEMHPFLAQAPELDRPTHMVFDLDPGPGAGLVQCAEVALRLRDELAAHRLRAWCKTSGGKGIHVYVPLHTAVDFERTKGYARRLAMRVEGDWPKRVTANHRKDLRKGRVLVDWAQNAAHKSTCSVYSLRARPEPTVSAPVTWDEVAAQAAGERELRFRTDEVLDRIAAKGDLFRPILSIQQHLPEAE